MDVVRERSGYSQAEMEPAGLVENENESACCELVGSHPRKRFSIRSRLPAVRTHR